MAPDSAVSGEAAMKTPVLPRRGDRTTDWVLRLTRREREILKLLMEGSANKQIASRLGVSNQTVKNQLSTLYQKVGVSSRLELVLLAQRHDLGV
jgi:DNA-binding NarL/FixJ family response regulator